MAEDQSRLCTRCGERNSAHFKFCWKCGTDLSLPPFQHFAPKRKLTLSSFVVPALFVSGLGYVALQYVHAMFPATMEKPSSAATPKAKAEVRVTLPAPVGSSSAATDWPQDRQVGTTDDGWTIFETLHVGCFARRAFPNGHAIVLGHVAGSGDFVVGMSGSVAKLPGNGYGTLTLLFDGIRRRQPYFQGYAQGVAGRFKADADLAEEFSRAAELQVTGEKEQTASLPMKGSRVALSAVNDCVRTISRKDDATQARESPLPKDRSCDDRPANGQLLTKRRGMRAGGHKLTIRNSGQGHAIVKVRQETTGKLTYSFFVHRNLEATISGVADGEYRIQFAYGDTLLENCTDYANPRATEFDRSVRFDTRVERTKKQIVTHTQDFTATLYTVTGGNAPTSSINQADFLKE